MPFAVALLAHPAGAYAVLIAAVAGLLYGAHARRFLPVFAGASAAVLTLLAAWHAAPNPWALLLLGAAVALFHAELLLTTAGVAGVLGLATATLGSWLALGVGEPSLPPAARLVLACAGSAALLLVTVRSLRLRACR